MALGEITVTAYDVIKLPDGYRYTFRLQIPDDAGPGIDQIFSGDHNENNSGVIIRNAIGLQMQSYIDTYKLEQARLTSAGMTTAAMWMQTNLTT